MRVACQAHSQCQQTAGVFIAAVPVLTGSLSTEGTRRHTPLRASPFSGSHFHKCCSATGPLPRARCQLHLGLQLQPRCPPLRPLLAGLLPACSSCCYRAGRHRQHTSGITLASEHFRVESGEPEAEGQGALLALRHVQGNSPSEHLT